MRNKFIRTLFSFLFFFVATSTTSAVDSMVYFENLLRGYDLDVRASFEDLGNTRNLVRSSEFEKLSSEGGVVVVLCDTSVYLSTGEVCGRDGFVNLLSNDEETYSIVRNHDGFNVVLVPENNLVVESTRSETVLELQSIFGIDNDPKADPFKETVSSYIIPWVELVGALTIIAALSSLGFLLPREKKFRIKTFSGLKVSDFFIKNAKVILFVGLASLVICFLGFAVLIYLKFGHFSKEVLVDSVKYLLNIETIQFQLSYRSYSKVVLLLSVYTSGFISTFLLLPLMVLKVRSLLSNGEISKKRVTNLYFLLNVIILVSFYFIHDSRLVVILLTLEVFLLVVYGKDIYKSRIKVPAHRGFVLVLTLVFAANLVLLFRSDVLFEDKNAYFSSLFSQRSESILLPTVVKNQYGEGERFRAYNVNPSSRLFIEDVLVFDILHPTIVNVGIDKLDKTKDYLIVGEMGEAYIKAILREYINKNDIQAGNITHLFDFPGVGEDPARLQFVFDCSQGLFDFDVKVKKHMLIGSRLDTVKNQIMHFPGCSPEQGNLIYSAQVNDASGLFELSSKVASRLIQVNVVSDGVVYTPRYYETPENFTILEEGDKGGSEIYTYSLEKTEEQVFKNVGTFLDLGVALNNVLSKDRDTSKVIIWSDIGIEFLEKHVNVD